MKADPLRRAAYYVAWTFACSAVFYAPIVATGRTGAAHGAYATGLMWCPALAALLACRIAGVPLSALGWRWGDGRWPLIGYLLPLAYAAIAYGGVWATGLGGAPDPAFIAWARKSLGWPGTSDGAVLIGSFALTASSGVLTAAASALGEEIGWRGFLSPCLTAAWGPRRGAVATGVVWTAWHLPLLLYADYHADTPRAYAIGCFCAMVVAMSVVMGWLRERSGSLWPPALLHASHNAFVQGWFTPVTATHGAFTAYAIGEFGFALPAAVALLAAAVARPRRA